MGWIEVGIIFVLALLFILYTLDVVLEASVVVLSVRVMKGGILFSNNDLSVKEPIDLEIKNIFTSVGYSVDGVVIISNINGNVLVYSINDVEKVVEVPPGANVTVQINEVGIMRNLRTQ